MTHEPEAPELAPDGERQAIFDRGHAVGELARSYVPGGVLIDLPHWQIEERVAATRDAIRDGARVIYEASFREDGMYAAIDILERTRHGFVLSEVKATTSAKPEHLPDVAVQLHIARKAGLSVRRAEVMHLNRECRYPDLSNLFVREDVTEDIADELAQVPQQAAALRTVLANPLPDVPAGDHCHSPYPCPFIDRCNPELPEHHISTLYQIRRHKRDALVADGIETIDQLNPEELPRGPARRQVESVRSGNLVVERGLARALRALRGTVAFLDFETINPPIPMWPGCSPYQALPVQMSCHILSGKRIDHHDWLATGPSDPRPELARALLRACAGAQSIVAWNASFERRCLETLADAVPQLRRKLLAVSDRIHDLLPIVRDHVYHPEFGGSFSLKRVAPALVPELDYDALDIANGSEASAKLEQLILHEDALNAAQAGVLCRELRKYCQLDTLALVKVYQRLRGLR